MLIEIISQKRLHTARGYLNYFILPLKLNNLKEMAVNDGTDLKRVLRKIFARYDLDETGEIDAQELSEMIFDYQCSFPDLYSASNDAQQHPVSPRRVAINIINKLDRDGNGELDEEEFCSWISAGLDMPLSERKGFAAQGLIASQLMAFLRSVERNVIIEQQELTRRRKDSRVRKGSKIIE